MTQLIMNLLKLTDKSLSVPQNQDWIAVMDEAVKLLDTLSPSGQELQPILSAIKAADTYFWRVIWDGFRVQIATVERILAGSVQ